MLNQKLQQKLQQKMSPQQIQLMKLLQIPTASLEQRIKEELEMNPALEEGSEDFEENSSSDEETYAEETLREDSIEGDESSRDDELDLAEYYRDDDVADYKTRGDKYNDDEEDRQIPIKVEKSFQETLADQISMLELDERQEQIAVYIIGNMDDDGYLRRDVKAMVDDIAFSQNIETTEEEIAQILESVQSLDPAGIGARDLQECLYLQLKRKLDEPEMENNTVLKTAIRIIKEFFEQFTKKHYDRLARMVEVSNEELKEAMEIILKLNPKPGNTFSSNSGGKQYITPDFFISNSNGQLVLSLNGRNAPELRISEQYKGMMEAYDKSKTRSKDQKDAVMFIKQKIDSAKWFIDMIQQRQMTLLGTMETIMNFQKEYFLTGDETLLKPMILKDIAEITRQDISTVSRVANSKYVQTEFGTIPLKYFFSEGITTDSGEEASSREVKAILTELIEAENKKKPLSDQKLTKLLQQKGYNIARRTVAKYREMLNIPVARLRKEL